MVSKKEAFGASVGSAIVITGISVITLQAFSGNLMLTSLIIGITSGLFAYYGMIRS